MPGGRELDPIIGQRNAIIGRRLASKRILLAIGYAGEPGGTGDVTADTAMLSEQARGKGEPAALKHATTDRQGKEIVVPLTCSGGV